MLELWGGFECSHTRIRDDYYDQLSRTGHASRIEDLDALPHIGVSAVRYPVLWEKVVPSSLAHADWSWTDHRLTRIRELDVQPIVGLVHHGSGPRWTSLVEPSFVNGLAEFAGAVARRYPWVRDYTPVNEPVTTARFATLYGHWYPHLRSSESFVRAVVIQCKAIVQAMRAIRDVNPEARLVSTDDFSCVRGTPHMEYQVCFENARRWLALDLLCGRVDPQHELYGYLRAHGVTEDELVEFLAEPCPPDIVGMNYYVTSERLLDEHLERYPEWTHGGNGVESYADVEAVRASADPIHTHETVLRETWDRYRIPVAITEAHLGCSREEQMRWFADAWNGALRARSGGADVRAVTLWALAGSCDWASLMTRNEGRYECGLIDARCPGVRMTGLAEIARAIAGNGELAHPILAQPGWWRRRDRILYLRVNDPLPVSSEENWSGAPILIAGATGTLGRAFARICERRGLRYELTSREVMDIAEAESVAAALDRHTPWAVVNAAGFVRVRDAEREAIRCMRENAGGTAVLARACAARGIPLLTFSSDLVFDGLLGRPYIETDSVRPTGIYGRSKAMAEHRAMQLHPDALVVRTSSFFGPWDMHNFLTVALQRLADGGVVEIADGGVVSPTYVPDLVEACLDLLIDREVGVWHLANKGSISWHDLARAAADECGAGRRVVYTKEASRRRARNTSLETVRGGLLPTLEDALVRYLKSPEMASLVAAAREAVGSSSISPTPDGHTTPGNARVA
jgi:dTDP-4-dehydrorhamnose reductase